MQSEACGRITIWYAGKEYVLHVKIPVEEDTKRMINIATLPTREIYLPMLTTAEWKDEE